MAKKRAHGTGSIVKGSGGIYQLFWTDANGKRHKKSLRTRDKRVAHEKARELEKGASAQDRLDVIHEAAKARNLIQEKRLPMDKVWTAYLDTKPTCSEGTQENHKRNLTRFLKWMATKHPAVTSFTQISNDMAMDYAEHLWKKGISAATFNYHRASLLAITNAIGRKYGIGQNPWTAVGRKNDEQQSRKTITPSQINSLLKTTKKDNELHTLLLLGAHAGMRLKDAALLRWADVDLGREVIEYRPYKTRRRNKKATVPITPDLNQALTKLDNTTEYVLPGIANKYKNHGDSLKKSLVKLIRTVSPDQDDNGTMQKQKTRKATGFHALRHYFCSTCANKGIPAVQLELMTGDQSRTLGKYYIRGEIDAEAVSAALVTPKQEAPEREKLLNLIENLPDEQVQKLLDEYGE
jgi:integrase